MIVYWQRPTGFRVWRHYRANRLTTFAIKLDSALLGVFAEYKEVCRL